jgi:lipopolysaccharide export system ATP-binding protein
VKLRAEMLHHAYGGRVVLNDLSVEVSSGEVVGLLGPNGAGKSTAMGIMAGQIVADSGKVFLGEESLHGLPLWKRVRRGLGYLSQEPAILRACTVRENLRVAADVSGISTVNLDGIVDAASLTGLLHARAGTLSGGERRRLEIARCLVGQPRILLMDEPFSGVDPVGIEQLQDTIEHLARTGIGILVTDHAVHATLGVCDRAIILDAGTVMASGCPDELASNHQVRDRYLGASFVLPKRTRKRTIP